MTLEHKMILSASGWRKIFAEDGDENSFTKKIGRENYILSALCARAFCTYLGKKLGKKNARIAVARDTRPTGSQICQAVIKTIKMCGQKVLYLDVASAPEIMAFSKKCDAFVYISASHNPVGHNGIKFGLSDGGVLEAEENRAVKEIFLSLLGKQVAEYDAFLKTLGAVDIKKILQEKKANKEKSLSYYRDFSRKVISDCTTKGRADLFFKKFVPMFLKRRITVCADFNGSARAACIDKSFFKECKIKFFSINSRPGQIAHAIIPEPENLGYVANLVEETAQALTKAKTGSKTLKASTAARASSAAPAILGYMPDCDGDRGNIVYWSERDKKAKILKAQEVFSLSVFAELNFLKERGAKKVAVCVNCPTSMRIEEIAKGFGAKVFRAEVGEANVVHLARKKRAEGWTVRILH